MPALEIGLAIEVLGFDVSDAVFLGGGADDDIGRERFIVRNPDDVANTNIFPDGFLPERLARVWIEVIFLIRCVRCRLAGRCPRVRGGTVALGLG